MLILFVCISIHLFIHMISRFYSGLLLKNAAAFKNKMYEKNFYCTLQYVCVMTVKRSAVFFMQSSLKSSKKKKRTSFKRKSSKKGAEVGFFFFNRFCFVKSSCLFLYLNFFS